MSVAIIQGCSSGLGQSLTRHLLHHTSFKIYALTHRSGQRVKDDIVKMGENRKESWNLDKDRLTVLDGIDVRDESNLEKAAGVVRDRQGKDSVRLIACMAGILHPEKSLSAIKPSEALDSFLINTLGHLYTYKYFTPLLPSHRALDRMRSEWETTDGKDSGGDPANGLVGSKNSLCWSMSARVGSIGDNERGGWYSYRASKAALNQIIRCLDHEFINKSSSGIAVGYHPGTVITPFTAPIIGSDAKPDKSQGRHTVEDATGYLVRVMSQIKRDKGGKEWGGRCWDWKGERIEW